MWRELCRVRVRICGLRAHRLLWPLGPNDVKCSMWSDGSNNVCWLWRMHIFHSPLLILSPPFTEKRSFHTLWKHLSVFLICASQSGYQSNTTWFTDGPIEPTQITALFILVDITLSSDTIQSVIYHPKRDIVVWLTLVIAKMHSGTLLNVNHNWFWIVGFLYLPSEKTSVIRFVMFEVRVHFHGELGMSLGFKYCTQNSIIRSSRKRLLLEKQIKRFIGFFD